MGFFALWNYLCSHTSTPSSKGGGANSKGGHEKLLFSQFFSPNCIKMKEIGMRGACVPGALPLGSANAVVNKNIITTSSFSEATDHLKDLDHLNAHSSGSSDRVREGARNMKSMWPPLATIFFMTYFYRAGGRSMAPLPPAPLDPLLVHTKNFCTRKFETFLSYNLGVGRWSSITVYVCSGWSWGGWVGGRKGGWGPQYCVIFDRLKA